MEFAVLNSPTDNEGARGKNKTGATISLYTVIPNPVILIFLNNVFEAKSSLPPEEEEEREITAPENENTVPEKREEKSDLAGEVTVETDKENKDQDKPSIAPEPLQTGEDKKELSGCRWFLSKVLYSFITLYTGYRTYFKYEVALAGLGLSFLYMTVLGFDKITIGKGSLRRIRFYSDDETKRLKVKNL